MNTETFHKLHEQLGNALARCEWDHASRILLDREAGVLYWPEPWIEVMKENPALAHDMAMMRPLPVEHLSPMTDELRELARQCGLPEYKGKAKANPPPMAGNARSRGERKRCPRCGEWMKDAGLMGKHKWDLTAKRTGESVCPNGCGT